MSDRSKRISKLLTDSKARAGYIKAKLGVLVPSQIRALRLRSGMPRQKDLADAIGMQQSRISMLETPGASNVTLETLAGLAAVFKVGLVVKFVPFSEMLRWENSFSQDAFNVRRLNEDTDFLTPKAPSIAIESGRVPLFVPQLSGAMALAVPEQQKAPLALSYTAPCHKVGMQFIR